MKWTEPVVGRRKPGLPIRGWDAAPKRLMDEKPVGYNSDAVREAIESFVREHKPNIWLVLSYQHPIGSPHQDYIAAHQSLERFINRLCKRAYGRRRVARAIRPKAFAFLEHASTNKHFNLLIQADNEFAETLKIYGEQFWRKLAPRSAGYHTERIQISKRVIRYCNKEQFFLGPYSTMYVYKAS